MDWLVRPGVEEVRHQQLCLVTACLSTSQVVEVFSLEKNGIEGS